MSNKPSLSIQLINLVITLFLIPILLCSSIFYGLKLGIFKDITIDGMMENLDAYTTINTLATDALKYEFESNGIYDDDILSAIPEDMIPEISKELVESLEDGRDPDFSFLDSYCTEITENSTKLIVSDVIAEAQNLGSITVSDLYENELVNDISKQYDVDLDSAFSEIFAPYGATDTVIDLSILQDASVQEEINASITDHLAPGVEMLFATYLDDINSSIGNNAVYIDFSESAEMAERYFHGFEIALIILTAISLVLILGNGAVYGRQFYHGIKNSGIAFLLSGLILAGIGQFMMMIKSRVLDYAMEDMNREIPFKTDAMSDFMDKLYTTVFDPFPTVGLISIGIFVLCLVIYVALKKGKSA